MKTLHRTGKLSWVIAESDNHGNILQLLTRLSGGRRLAMSQHHRARAEGDLEHQEMLRAEKEKQAARGAAA